FCRTLACSRRSPQQAAVLFFGGAVAVIMGQALGNALAFCRPRPHDDEPCHNFAHTSTSTPPAAAGASTNAANAVAAAGAGVSGSFVHQRQPRVMEDAEQQECYGCSVAFDVLVRRHHCRRCCNIYCQRCSSQSD
ncbi:unnamed protein product, partial [Ectocarpus sp. 12 AP-2014]